MTDLEIEKANVIILVYDVNNIECIKRLKSFWIPRIIKINDKVTSFILILLMTPIDSNHFSWK